MHSFPKSRDDVTEETASSKSMFITVSSQGNIGGWNVKDGSAIFWKSLKEQGVSIKKSCKVASSYHQEPVIAILLDGSTLVMIDEKGTLKWSWSSQAQDGIEWNLVFMDEMHNDKEDLHETILVGHFKNQSLALVYFNTMTGEVLHQAHQLETLDLGTASPEYIITGHDGQYLVWLDDAGNIRGYDLDAGHEIDFHLINKDESFSKLSRQSKKLLSLDQVKKRDYFVVQAGNRDLVLDLSDHDGETALDYHLLPIVSDNSFSLSQFESYLLFFQ